MVLEMAWRIERKGVLLLVEKFENVRFYAE